MGSVAALLLAMAVVGWAVAMMALLAKVASDLEDVRVILTREAAIRHVARTTDNPNHERSTT